MPVTNYDSVEGLLLGETTGSSRADYMTDALGSVVGTAGAAGAPINFYRYKPYGETLIRDGTDPDPRFLWTGETGSRNSGAKFAGQYNRARHYGREQGNWMSVDPLWPEELAYAYAEGNPTTSDDPSGMKMNFDCADCYGCWDELLDYNPVVLAAKRVCRNLKACAKSPGCRTALLKCLAKHSTKAGSLLDCMARKCDSADVSCGGLPCGPLYDLRGPKCGQTYGGSCRIHICGELQIKALCKRPDPCTGRRNPIWCWEPTCGPEETFAHELSHCCGTEDEPSYQAEKIGQCIASFFGFDDGS